MTARKPVRRIIPRVKKAKSVPVPKAVLAALGLPVVKPKEITYGENAVCCLILVREILTGMGHQKNSYLMQAIDRTLSEAKVSG